ncbi:MAG: hypothetical protein OXC46_10405 [Thaumarchaeota archaeon]|nr:hypothetical protein [Nitrososphaerota archaeon]
MRLKILLDSTIIIAASIYNTREKTGLVENRSGATDLINELIKHVNEKIGITTQTLYAESMNGLKKGIKNAMPKTLSAYDETNTLERSINVCEDEVYRLSMYLFQYTSEYLKGKELQDAKVEIEKLSKYIKVRHETMYKDDDSQRKEAERRTKIEIKQQQNKGSWKVIFEKYREQVRIESKQVKKFMSKEPNAKKLDGKKSNDGNSGDKRILTESAAIKYKLEKNKEPIDFYIASYDTGFFSPQLVNGKKSDVVTKEIKKRFGIICDHPGEIIRQCFSDR